ncbi:MAG: helicase [Pseudomonadales bacterium]|nr:helicase [Pseudomonadales bacterium]
MKQLPDIADSLLTSRVYLSAKFLAIVSALSWKMYRKSCTDPKVQAHLGNKNISFQLQTRSASICRHFLVSDQRITSAWGAHKAPDLSIIFNDAVIGTRILTADGKRLAFMQGMQNKEVEVQGDLSLFMWYVELGSMLNQ